ncbi:hypothetical protein M9H77_02259 [Catharanthus roseus]|uniref:Uncharacterized protein n=1 Tax=Catharanthus roseus TaxID=4058 RepID=A0ACC0C838_CATRO|nr:hypothetical protein M9H77_02259 [Catharanthus roseus]
MERGKNGVKMTKTKLTTQRSKRTASGISAIRAKTERMMVDYARLSISGTQLSIARQRVEANNFEIKPNIIKMVQNNVQFDGLPYDNPNAHIGNFLEICDTFKINRVHKRSQDRTLLVMVLFPLGRKDVVSRQLGVNLFLGDQDLKIKYQAFGLQLGDSRDELGRRSGLQLQLQISS